MRLTHWVVGRTMRSVRTSIQSELIAAACAAICNRRYPADLFMRLDTLSIADLYANPWVALLQGRRLCRLHSRFAEAAPLIDHALGQFRAAANTEGQIWALAEQIVMYYHTRRSAEGLALANAALAQPMRPYLRAELQFGRFLCLISDGNIVATLAAGEAALNALDQEPDGWLQMTGRVQMLRNIAAAYHYNGQNVRATAAALGSVTLAQLEPELASALPWCWYELGLAYWRQGQLDDATEAADTARRLAEQWEHSELWRWAVALQGHILRDQNQLDAALAAYNLAKGWGELPEGPALLQIRQNRLYEARWSCDVLLPNGDNLWQPADSRVLLAIVELKSGNAEAALALLEPVPAIYEQAAFHYHAATARLYEAAAALAADLPERALTQVAAYLRFAAHEQVLTAGWWVPELIEPLLLFALRRGIEPGWAQHILERRFLHEPQAQRRFDPDDDVAAELIIARRTQLALLPDAPPRMPDLDLAAVVLPAAKVGGDFVGYFPCGAQPEAGEARTFGLAVGDISGKGLAAALLLSGIVVALNTVAANAAPPAQVAQALHGAMQPYTIRNRMNIAFCYTLLTHVPSGWNVRTIGCGAVPPLIRRASGELEWIDTAGLPLGTVATMIYREVTAQLAPGDTLLLMSDGVIEAMDRGRTLFSFERVERTLTLLDTEATAAETLSAVLRAVERHTGAEEQHDDITLVVLRAESGQLSG